MKKIDVRVTEARLKRYVTLDEMIAVQEGSLRAIRDVMPRFMWDETTNDYYPVTVEETDDSTVICADPTALRLMGSVTMERLEQVAKEFQVAATGTATNPPSATPSGAT